MHLCSHRLYLTMVQAEYQEGDALDALQLKRYCCRRMLLGHVVHKTTIKYPSVQTCWKIDWNILTGPDWKVAELRSLGEIEGMLKKKHIFFKMISQCYSNVWQRTQVFFGHSNLLLCDQGHRSGSDVGKERRVLTEETKWLDQRT